MLNVSCVYGQKHPQNRLQTKIDRYGLQDTEFYMEIILKFL